jgi:hypothetical protein
MVPSTAKQHPVLLALARTHALYLALLPVVVVAIAEPWSDFGILFSFAPIAVWVALLAVGYRLSASTPRALFVVFAVPLQLIACTWLGGADVRSFIYEAGFIEVLSVILGLFIAMVRYMPSGPAGAGVVGVLCVLPWLDVCWGLLREVVHWPWAAQALLLSATATATAHTITLFSTAALEHLETGSVVEVELRRGTSTSTEETVSLGIPESKRAALIVGVMGLWILTIFGRGLVAGLQQHG